MDKTQAAASIMGLAAQIGLSTLPGSGKVTGVEGEMSFADTLMKTSGTMPSVDVTEELATKKTAVAPTEKSTQNSIKSSNSAVKQQQETSKAENRTEDVSEKVSEKATEITEKIKSEFGVSDEEIETAMEVLALSAQDLFNPVELRNLVMELTGTTDSIELITNVELYEGIKEITTLADDLLGQISEELSIPKEELAEIMNSDSFIEAMKATVSETEEVANAEETVNTENILSTAKDTASTKERTEKPVEVTVEVENSTDLKAADSSELKINTQNETSSNNGENKKQNMFNKQSNQENIIQTQTVTTQTVNTVGDIVETITSYSSYAETENIMRQVTDFVKVNISEDVTKMEMQLHPASLGTVNMQINSQNGQITAHLTVQNELVKTILESQMVKLQETFNEQGTKVTAIEVSVANYNLDAKGDNNYSQEENHQGRKGNSRRGINLNEIESFDELTEEEQLQAEIMEMNGGSVNYTA